MTCYDLFFAIIVPHYNDNIKANWLFLNEKYAYPVQDKYFH